MHFLHLNLQFIIVLCLLFCASNAHAQGKIAKTIVVDQKGQGDFTNVQQATDSIPSNNNAWTKIHVKAGIYNEKVKVPRDKQFIVLEGEDPKRTIVQSKETGSSSLSATFIMDADNFVAAKISFRNTYNLIAPYDVNGNPIVWAPAALITGDKASFYHCGFSSVQDTLTDSSGRHYYFSSYFQGAIDFIWGRGQSVFERSVINATTALLNGTAGYITAQGRDSDDDSSGFVFLICSIAADGPVYLGRAYRQYSRVVYKNTYMSDHVKPEGWSSWDQAGKEDSITFAEVGCRGPGADTSKRVKWEKNLSSEDLNKLIDANNFINQDGWLQQQPKI